MVDVVGSETRSRMMSGIKGKNTKPETMLRKALHAAGYRFRLHRRDLPGSPDVVLPRYRAVILVNGCFWHGHACPLFKWPKTRSDFWRTKIQANMSRDSRNLTELKQLGWRVCILWECEMKGADLQRPQVAATRIMDWLESDKPEIHLPHSNVQQEPDAATAIGQL